MKNSIQKFVIVSDFDGTISKKDFFTYATESILTDNDMLPWLQYKKGQISHVNALNQIFNKIHLPKNEFDNFIDKIEIEEYFLPTLNLCREKSIDFHIVSAGADYYILRILERIGAQNVNLLTNPSDYSQERGLELYPPNKTFEFYDEDLGVSKKDFVLKLKSKGYFVLFAGDGMPDIDAAKVADVVFARDYLVDLCNRHNIQYKRFETYYDIYKYILEC